MAKIMLVAEGVDIMPLALQIERHPDLWNQHAGRTEGYASPHQRIDDIWVRYNHWSNFDGDMAAFNEAHESVWYPAATQLPAVRDIVFPIMARVHGERLGGVLITRIPPGGRVEPHTDHGWHAEYYAKYAVQIKSARGQAFCFEGEQLATKPGDVYWFDNAHKHWVVNDSDVERMTMIVCIRSS